MSLSSLNRHAVATRADVGISKAQCLKEHFLSIFPECQVEAKVLLYDATSEEEILSGKPDFVLDCIDNIHTKVICETVTSDSFFFLIILLLLLLQLLFIGSGFNVDAKLMLGG